MRFLIDTNVISEIRHSHGSEQVKARVNKLDEQNVFTSAVVFGELTKGVNSLPEEKRKAGLKVWLEHFESQFGERISPYDRHVAKVWGEMVADGMSKGFRFGVSDGQIAATAIFQDITVITRNEKHFQPTGAKIWNIWDSDCLTPRGETI